MQPCVIVACVASVINIILNMLFIHGTKPFGGSWAGWHYMGSPIATSVSNWLLFVGIVVWTMPMKGYHRKTWQPLSTLPRNLSRPRVRHALTVTRSCVKSRASFFVVLEAESLLRCSGAAPVC